ncbi:hypothetical protein METP2_02123 [Methanosarcinales archaeon]|nr:hypothetical protein METP2_02123 [Methanosarcinales archaeon]
MAEKNKNPDVRFAGFTDDWEQHELREVLTERKILQKISDDAPILAFASGQGVIDRSERKSNNRDHLTLDPTNKIYKLTEYNDIVYNPSNLKYGAIDRNKHGRGVISPIYVTFTTEEQPSFIELIVKSEKFKLRALQYEEGTVVKRQSVKPENLLSLNVKISPSRDEQKKIGAFFEHIENSITIHQQKYDKLVTIKKAMLDKMFPKNGAYAPDIRFKGFTDPWKERELGEVTDSNSGGTPLTTVEEYYNGEIPWAIIADLTNSSKYIKDTNKHITKKGLENSNAILFPPNTLLFAMYGSIGSCAITKIQMASNQAILGFNPSKEVDVEFIYYILLSLKRNFTKLGQQGTQANLNKGLVTGIKIAIPVLQEQKKIGNYFQNLDNLIIIHKEKLEKLKNIKIACFEKMFV